MDGEVVGRRALVFFKVPHLVSKCRQVLEPVAYTVGLELQIHQKLLEDLLKSDWLAGPVDLR